MDNPDTKYSTIEKEIYEDSSVNHKMKSRKSLGWSETYQLKQKDPILLKR